MLQFLHTLNYQLIINPKLKYIHLTLNNKGELIVKSPTNSRYKIEKLLQQKRAWIEKAQKRFMQKKGKLPSFESSENKLYYLGKSYPIKMIPIPSSDSNNLISFEYIPQKGFTLKYK